MKSGLIILGALIIPSCMEAQVSFAGRPLGPDPRRTDLSTVPVITLPTVDAGAELAADAHNASIGRKGPYRFGVEHLTDIRTDRDGVWDVLPQGQRLWRIKLQCPQAVGIGVTFTNYVVPPGGRVFVYNDAGQVLGGYTADSHPGHTVLGVQPLPGSTVTVEYQEPGVSAGQGHLTLGRVVHAYRAPWAGFDRAFGDSGPCNVNTICPEGDDWRPEIRSVALVLAGGGSCTGQLLNNCNNDSIPYFLTANHCLGGADPSTWVFRFNWESPTCDPTANGPTDHTVSGSTQLAANPGSDMLFLQLNDQPPPEFNAYFNGWDKSGAVPQQTTCIHHPSGDIKKITHDLDPSVSENGIDVGNGPADCWHVFNYETGTTEPGSSGSGLWDQAHHIVGQLYGGSASCTNNNDDWYGRFSVSYPFIEQWLGACGDTLNGLDPGITVPITTNNTAITSIVGIAANICNEDSVQPVVTLKNNGTAYLASVTITYEVLGGATGTMGWSGNLAPLQTANVQLPMIAVGNGAQSLVVSTEAPNGSNDGDPTDDSDTLDFVVNSPGELVTLLLSPDNFGEDITWDLANADGTVLYAGGPYANNSTTPIEVPFCLGDDCYTFTINDVFGDGICCSEGQGHYTITSAFGDHVVSDGQYGQGEVREFCLEGVGIDALSAGAVPSIWPNPATDRLTLHWPTVLSQDLRWSLVDMNGRLLTEGRVARGAQRSTIALPTIADGVYVLTTITQGSFNCQRLVVQR